MNMYEFIRSMSKEQMRDFIYWVYMNGHADAKYKLCDNYGDCGYFDGTILNMDMADVMPKVYALYDHESE